MTSLEFVPYGVTVEASGHRTRYVEQLRGYMAKTVQGALRLWEGELPAHLEKVRSWRGRQHWQSSVCLTQHLCENQ